MSSPQALLRSPTLVILTLILTIIIDVMGMGLVFPVIPSLFISQSAILVTTDLPEHVRIILYGLAMGSWPAGIFFGTPFLGELSDRFGRKRILLTCLGITALSYALAGFALLHSALALFLIARFLAGFFGGSFTIAQAVIADISPAKLKARNLGWITLAASLGIIVGPSISSLTITHVSAHSFAIPFWIAATLAAFNTLCILVLLQETHEIAMKTKIKLHKIFTAFLIIFTDKRTWLLAIIFFLLQLGWGFYIQEIPLVLTQFFHFKARTIGYFFTTFGFALMIGVLFVQPALLKRFRLKPLFITSAIAQALLLSLTFLMPTLKVHWSVMLLGAILNLLCYTSCLTLFSESVSEEEQGQVMGGTGCAFGAAWMLNALCLGFLANRSLFLPLILASVCILLSGLAMIYSSGLKSLA